MPVIALLLAGVTAAAAGNVYWWHYSHMDAEKLDIKQLSCGSSCTLDELETACLAEPTCVAFNTDGWLKYSISDMATDVCDLYVLTPHRGPSHLTGALLAFHGAGSGVVFLDSVFSLARLRATF